MTDETVTKPVLKRGIQGRRRRERPNKKLFNAVQKDLKELGTKKWEEKTKDRDKWREIANKANGLQGL